MLKQLILLFHLVSMSFVTIFLSDGIEIESNLPDELVKDSTYIVDVIIKKGDLFGFAKYQQDFPEGFEAKPVETAEASFTFADGKMKFIWMALPEIDEVKVTYALTAYADAPEQAVVEGKFSYIQDNERKSYDIPNRTVRVISDEVEEAKLPALAEVSRQVTDEGGGSYRVDLTIDKQGIYGFSKLEEYLPAGAEAEMLTGEKSVFSQVDEKAKFVWMSIPEGDQLKIAYSVKASGDVLAQLQSMEGNFAFLDENQTKTVAILGTEIDEAASIAQVEEVTAPEQSADSSDLEIADVGAEETPQIDEAEPEQMATPDEAVNPQVEELMEEQVNIPEQTASAEETVIPERVTDIPSPETGIVYKVQIVAGHKVVEETYLRETYKFQEAYVLDNHEGWVKYITGQFNVYKQARDKRESLLAAQHNFPGPFVTAYNAGERITVQEALMISNQQWFK
ncbi:MAG: hypothetical protein HQ500_13510 [Flavobacteriales bacterium]|nr:hypothetical protein [Flavobacteriales bacterium]